MKFLSFAALFVSMASEMPSLCKGFSLTTNSKRSVLSGHNVVVLQSSSSSTSSSSLEYLDVVEDGVVEMGFDLGVWESCGELLASRTGLSNEQALDLLAQAWSWKSWATIKSKFARKYIKPKEPSLQILEKALDWLSSQDGPLLLSDPQQLSAAIASDPVSYLNDPALSYQKAQAAAPDLYKSDNEAFRALVLEKPAAIKNYYNCADKGCNSECGNCWVSYEIAGHI